MTRETFNPNVDEFIRKYEELNSSRKMGEYYGVSKTTIINFTKEIGYKKIKKNHRYEDLSNQEFGTLKVLRIAKIENDKVHWYCECKNCDRTVIRRSDYLKTNLNVSCGKCASVTHGKSDTRIYRIHHGMINRCKDKGNYSHVEVCDEWLDENGFMNFYNWAIENGYSDDLTIDRIDVYGNYEPSNCRWATHKEQQNNKTNNRWLEFNGEMKTASQWAEYFNVYSSQIFYMFKKYGNNAIYELNVLLTEELSCCQMN